MTTRDKLLLVVAWLATLKFLGHELHSAWLIHRHFKHPPEIEVPEIKPRKCSECVNSEVIPFKEGALLCQVSGLMDPVEVCELFEPK